MNREKDPVCPLQVFNNIQKCKSFQNDIYTDHEQL